MRVGGVWVGGMVGALEWVTKDNDELESRVREYREIQIASRHLVDFIDDEDGGGFEERAFPSGKTPDILRVWVHVAFPLVAQFRSGGGNPEVAEGAGAEKVLYWVGFAAASETGYVDEGNGASSGHIDERIEAV